VFVGSEIGLLKGVDIQKNSFSNINFSESLCKDDEITAMCWEDSSEKRIYIGQRDQTVKIYDCGLKSFSSSECMKIGEGPIKGLSCYNGKIVTAVESGIVKLWDKDSEENLEINTEGNLSKMVANQFKPQHIATGGEENDLKIWDLQNHKIPIFKAKNVRNDFLDLRVPVWITDLKFRPDDKIVTCTRHHQVRLYDPKAQKRPVIDMEFERYPLMCVTLSHNEHQVIVGSSRGRMALIDLRMKLLVHVFKGFAGSIRYVQCHPTLPVVASCGLDRFFRIHDLNKHKLIKKIYLKTRLNCLLMRNSIFDVTKPEAPKAIENKETSILDEEDEKIWDSMIVLKEDKRKKTQENGLRKLKKQKFEGSS